MTKNVIQNWIRIFILRKCCLECTVKVFLKRNKSSTNYRNIILLEHYRRYEDINTN